MADIPFPTSSAPGEHPQDGAGRLINAFCSKTPQGARAPLQWLRAAGLRPAITLGTANCRGMIEVNGSGIVVQEGQVYGLSRSGVGIYSAPLLGPLSGSLPVTIARNSKTPTPDIVAVTAEGGAWNLFQGAAPTPFADTDLPVPNSVAGHQNYLVFTIGDGRIFATNLNSVSVNSLSYTTARGPLRRGVSFGADYIAFGKDFFQIYRDVGATPFPLDLAGTVRRGIAGAHAIAGWEEGGANILQWVADDDTVVRYAGAAPPAIVSNADVARAIAGAADKSLLEASVYAANGISFWVITNPGVWTWEMNLQNGEWNERKSYEQDGWRVRRTVRVFERWLAGDRATGALYEIDPLYRKEGGEPLIFDVTSGAFAQFPNRLDATGAAFDFTAAAGNATGVDPIETDPVALIYVSRDGGYSWSRPLTRKLGRQGVADALVRISNMGEAKSKGYRVRVVVSDPVGFAFMGGRVPGVELRAA